RVRPQALLALPTRRSPDLSTPKGHAAFARGHAAAARAAAVSLLARRRSGVARRRPRVAGVRGFDLGAAVGARLGRAATGRPRRLDRKSTRLNSSHVQSSYA